MQTGKKMGSERIDWRRLLVAPTLAVVLGACGTLPETPRAPATAAVAPSETADARIAVGKERDGPGEQLAFHVTDNGAGFPPEYAGKLFRPFQRLHNQEQFDGHGIGLASVKRIIERHGGTVDAEGRPGEGATFRFTLPREVPVAG